MLEDLLDLFERPHVTPFTSSKRLDSFPIRKRQSGSTCRRAAGVEYGERRAYQLLAIRSVNSTGMLLKAKTFDEKNELLEQFAFTQLKIGGPISRDQLKARYLRQSRDWRVEDSGATRANLAEAGWTIRARPAGFRTVTELMRTMGGTSGIGHIVLSDGLAAISVFIQPATSKQPAPQPGLARQGAINVYVRPVGSYWVTVVGEAPPESVKYIANAVEYHR